MLHLTRCSVAIPTSKFSNPANYKTANLACQYLIHDNRTLPHLPEAAPGIARIEANHGRRTRMIVCPMSIWNKLDGRLQKLGFLPELCHTGDVFLGLHRLGFRS